MWWAILVIPASTWETKAGGPWWASGQPRLCSKSLPPKNWDLWVGFWAYMPFPSLLTTPILRSVLFLINSIFLYLKNKISDRTRNNSMYKGICLILSTWKKLKSKQDWWDYFMVKDICYQVWQSKFNPQDPQGRRREWLSKLSTIVHCDTCSYIHI